MRFVLLSLIALSLGGCIIVSSNKTTTTGGRGQSSHHVIHDLDPRDVTTREIDAAASLQFDDAKVSALQKIARRPNLDPYAQVRLIWAAYTRLGFDDGKMAVITTVLNSPACADEARSAALDGLGHLAFESNRQIVLDSIRHEG